MAQNATRGAPTTRGAPARAAPRAATPPVAGAATPEARIQACAARLSGHALAVDTLITSLGRALEHPHDEKYRRVDPSNRAFQKNVASAPGGVDFLYAVGFEPMHGHLVLHTRNAALLWIGKAALEAVRGGAAYAASKERAELQRALALSTDEYERQAAARRAAFLARVPDEPPAGSAGNSLLAFHVGEATTWRRFESCHTLEDLANFARSLPGAPVGARIALSNVTLSPAIRLDLDSQLGLTLQRLDLWPTGHIRVEPAA